MTETINNEQIEELSLEKLQIEILNDEIELLSNNEQYNETIEFLNKCNMSIFEFSKDNTNAVILTPKEKTIKKKYKLYQYNLNIEYSTFMDITKYLTNLDIHINLKTLLKNKLLKIELII